MNNSKYQQIVLKIDDYANDKEKLFEVIGKQLQILLDSGYLAVVKYDEPGLGIVVIEFENNEKLDALGCYNPVWLNEEEEDFLLNNYKEQYNPASDPCLMSWRIK